MNIALFSDSYIPTKSGIVTVVVQLRNILEQLGHHVVIVTVGGDSYARIEDPNVFRVKSIASPVGDNQYIGLPLKRSVKAFLREHHIQIIHSHTEFFVGHVAIKIGKELGIPVVASTHTMWEDYYNYYFFFGNLIPKSVIRKTVKKLYKKFYALINVSEKAHNYFNEPFMLPGVPSAIIPNAIDTKKFVGNKVFSEDDKKNLKLSLGFSPDDKILLYVGRVVEEKRLNELLEIAKKVVSEREDVKMLFVGSGEREGYLRENVWESGLAHKIKFLGFVDWSKLYSYYSIGDLFVTVSLSEMHSMTILESLALGVPVVCEYDTSFSDTVFDGVNGFFGKDDDEVHDKILKMLDLIDNDKVAYQKMKENALEISSRFSLEHHGRRTLAFYEEVLETYPNPISSESLQKVVDKIS